MLTSIWYQLDRCFLNFQKGVMARLRLFCLNKAPGPYSIEENKYLALQKEYLLNGAAGDYTLAFKKPNGTFEIKKPSNEAEKNYYLEFENARSKNCSQYFDSK